MPAPPSIVSPIALERPQRSPTVARAVRRFCLGCLGATTARAAFDCLSGMCPLYVCMPFRGKAMPKSLSPARFGESARNGRLAEREAARAKELPGAPRRRPSKKLIGACCRHCQPEDRSDCGATDCALHPYRPWEGPGKAPRRRVRVAAGSVAALARANARSQERQSHDSEAQFSRRSRVRWLRQAWTL